VTSVMPARRRAERFNAWVEGNTPGALIDARFVEVVAALRSVESPAPRPDFAADLRERLMAAADTDLVRTERNLTVPTSLAPTQRRHHRRVAVAASALVVVGATASMSMAAQHALPGDTLYPIKRALENAQTGLASGDAKTQEMLSNASSRLNEATALAHRDSPETDTAIVGTLDDFTAQAQAAADQALASHDPAQITQLRDFAAQSMQALELLDSVVSPDAHKAVASAAQLLTALDSRASTQCPICGGAVIDLPKIFLTTAAPHAGQAASAVTGTKHPAGVQPVVPQLSVPEVMSAAHPADSSQTGTQGTGPTQAPQPLVPSGTGASKGNPLDALDQLLTPSGTSSTNPLEPVTGPVTDTLTDTVKTTVGALTPKQ
jgi:hypothetical protein